MADDAWLPIGHVLPDGTAAKRVLYSGPDWQIVETSGGGRALIATERLTDQWVASGLAEEGALRRFLFGKQTYSSLSSGLSQVLAPIVRCKAPSSKSEALAFALSMKATRDHDEGSPLQDAIYAEAITRLLPTYSVSPRIDDEILLGRWLTGGVQVSAKSFRRLSAVLSWLAPDHLRDIMDAAGFASPDLPGIGKSTAVVSDDGIACVRAHGDEVFSLPGRPELEAFLNEHVVEIIRNADRYKALGVGFPSAIVLHGPPGSGKTFAVERLVDFLGWPSFEIDASTVASPYIHETSRKIAEVFEKARQNAPSVLVIDEMEAFLADRDIGSGASHHRVEEVAEFLRRIPEAANNQVLVVAMTNRVDMIDPAILRRGRFDNIVKLNYPTEDEVRSLMQRLLADIPTVGDINCSPFAKMLAGRPLSDATFVVREGARLAARSGRNSLDAASLSAALKAAPSRTDDDAPKIGFHIG
jgi:Cdc6-like AAA superfamily ATPase